MNVDKEMLLKHRFWIILGVSVPLILVAVIMLSTSVAGAIEAQRGEVEKSKDSLKKITNPKNQKFIDQLNSVDEQIAGNKNNVWAKAWKVQQGLMTFPEGIKAKFEGKYFGDPINHFDRSEFVDTHYVTQLRTQLYTIVNPIDPKTGDGVMQFRGDWESVVQPIRSWPARPTDEDIWYAQEDVWVKRELMRVAKDANDLVGIFKGPKPPATPADKAKLAAGEELVDAKSFTNQNWEVDLRLTKNAQNRHYLRGTIKNISKRRMPLGMYLMVKMQRATSEGVLAAPVMVDGDPLAVGESTPIMFHDREKKIQPVDFANPVGLFGVEQVFNWRTAPVKRIDVLAMGYPAHRIATKTLKPHPAFAPKAEDGSTPAPDASAPTPNMPSGTSGMGGMGSPDGDASYGGGRSGGKGMGMGGAPGMGGGAAANLTANGLVKDRYLDVTPAVRRMPVAVLFVVDQNYMQEVLAAFANSRLRIQTLQVHWQRCYDNLKPSTDDPGFTVGGGGAGGAGPGPGMSGRMGGGVPGGGLYGGDTGSPDGGGGGGKGFGGGRTGGMTMGMGMGMGPGGAGFGTLQNNPEEEEDLNLVEVSMYGIASLYERYPPKPAPGEAGKDGAAPPTDGSTPATPAPATGTPAPGAPATGGAPMPPATGGAPMPPAGTPPTKG